jgi:hypothetical protein
MIRVYLMKVRIQIYGAMFMVLIASIITCLAPMVGIMSYWIFPGMPLIEIGFIIVFSVLIAILTYNVAKQQAMFITMNVYKLKKKNEKTLK